MDDLLSQEMNVGHYNYSMDDPYINDDDSLTGSFLSEDIETPSNLHYNNPTSQVAIDDNSLLMQEGLRRGGLIISQSVMSEECVFPRVRKQPNFQQAAPIILVQGSRQRTSDLNHNYSHAPVSSRQKARTLRAKTEYQSSSSKSRVFYNDQHGVLARITEDGRRAKPLHLQLHTDRKPPERRTKPLPPRIPKTTTKWRREDENYKERIRRAELKESIQLVATGVPLSFRCQNSNSRESKLDCLNAILSYTKYLRNVVSWNKSCDDFAKEFKLK